MGVMQELPIELIDFAEFMADEARKISRLYYRSQLGVEIKDDKSPVTEADRKIEETIRKLVANNFPDHGVFGEEFGHDEGKSQYLWVIDPIDGTKSFISGRPIFGTLISLVTNERPVLGIIDQPITNERWIGANGVTRHNDRQVNTRTGIKMRSAMFVTTTPLGFTERGKYIASRLAEESAFAIYGGDCYSYGQLAMGLVDIVVEDNLKPYDFCALVPIIENAGGIITDWHGNSININSKGSLLACGDPHLHRQLLENYF